MELSQRKQAVLKALVKAYIETGEPIGSKNLTLLLENAPSSATLRNEMSELCELGLLSQPHTSAGRVPTSKGYRLYVNSLMSKNSLNDTQKEFIDNSLQKLYCEPELIPEIAAKIVSELTGLPAITCLLTEKIPRVKRVEFLKIGKFSFMMLLITDDGRTRNKVFRFSGLFEGKIKETFENLIEDKIKGKSVNELNKPYMQSVIASAGLYSLELLPFFTAVFEIAAEIESAAITLSGENALYNISSDEVAAKRIVSLIKRRDPIISLFQNIDSNVGVVFGADTSYGEILSKETLIAAKFNGSDKYKGYIGVIGPNRMSYEQIIPCIEYTAKKLTEIMTEAQKDMED